MAIFTVYFESPWWVGVLEFEDAEGLRAHRVVFGPEPSGPQLHTLINERWGWLRALPSVAVAPPRERSPKRVARERARQVRIPRPSSKAQEALAATRQAVKRDLRQARKKAKETREAHRQAAARKKALARRRGR